MPTVKKKKTFKKSSSKETDSPAVDGNAVSGNILPTEKNKPSDNLFDYSMIVYGERKIGKTTLAAQIPDALLVEFEAGAKALEAYISEIGEYEKFYKLTDAIIAGNHNYRSIVIDTGGVAYEMGMDYACQVFDIEHPGAMNDYGASWSHVKKIFIEPMRRLLNSKFGFVVLAHEQEKEIETRSGRQFIKMRPDFSSQADQFFTSQIDNIFYYYYEHGERWLQIEGDEYVTAGHRIKNHFLTPKGERVCKVPMGNSETEAYKNLMTAFNNKQKNPYTLQSGKEESKGSGFKK